MRMNVLISVLMLSFTLTAETNRADYDFFIELDDSLKIIKGYADITYHNNTSDTLKQMNFHLTANMFKSNSEFLKKSVHPLAEGYTTIDSVFEDSDKNENLTVDYTMAYLNLIRCIEPHKTKSIRIYFTNKIPYPYLREGWAKDRYDISQWYPKISVYKEKKWADFQGGRLNEFYNEYGDYSLTITMPEDLFLFGTGEIVSNDDEIQKIRDLGKSEPKKQQKQSSSTAKKTLKYEAKNVNDFAFSMMRNFKYISITKDSLTVEIACLRQNYDKYLNQRDNIFDMIDYYSKKYYPYPYRKITVADGLLTAGGGMEYPMFIVMGSLPADENFLGEALKARYLEDVLAHEAAHQWFYLISGSNEFEEPFMDEGFATYSELSYMENKYKENNYISVLNKKFINLFDAHYMTYINMQTNKRSFPMNSKSTDAEETMEYSGFYSKGFLVIRAIESIMGYDVFDSAMKSYFSKYAFTHPSIDDLLTHLNSHTNDVYYDELRKLITENVYTDYSVSLAKLSNNSRAIVIKNSSSTDLPVKVFVEYSDKTNETLTKKIDFDTIYLERNDIKNVIVDKEMRYMDTYYHDNSLNPGLKIHILPQMPDYFKNNLYFLPLVDYTLFDKFTYGISAYFCDVPKIEGELSLGKSNYGLKTDIGWNPKTKHPLFKLNAYSEQGDILRTGTQIDFKYAEDYFKITPSLYACQFQSDASYKLLIAYMSRTSTDAEGYFTDVLTEGNLRGLQVSLKGLNTKDKFAFRYNLFSFLYDPIFYSDIKSARIDFEGDVSYKASNLELRAGIGSSFIYGERNRETSLYLYRDGFAAFDDYSKNISDHTFTAYYLNSGFGFITDDTTNYKALNKVRLSAGNVLYGYSDFILAGNYRDGRYLIQSGLLLNIMEMIKIEIPIYNTEFGLLLHDRFIVGININLLKAI